MLVKIADSSVVVQAASKPIHAHMLSDCDACPRKAFMRHVLNIRPVYEKPSEALDIGSLVHLMMDERYRGTAEDEAFRAGGRACDTRIGGLHAASEKGYVDPSDLEKLVLQTERAFTLAKVIVRIFWKQYPLSGDLQPEAHEATLTATGHGFDVEGRLDLALRSGEGHVWVVDHKTSSDPPSETSVGMLWDNQKLLYEWLARAKWGEAFRGFIFNYIQKPTIRYCNKDADFDAYVTRCEEWYANQAERPIASYAVRATGDQPSLELLRKLSQYHQRIIEPTCESPFVIDPHTVRLDDIPRVRRACSPFRGRPCTYLPFCEQPPSAWPSLWTHFTRGWADGEQGKGQEEGE